MTARTVLILGGPADGSVQTVLHGNGIIIGTRRDRAEYEIRTVRGSDSDFTVAVPADQDINGDWIIARLLANYRRAA